MPKNAPDYPKKMVIRRKNGQKRSRQFLHDVEKQDKLSIFENCKEEYYIV